MRDKLYTVHEGEIYGIPLFVSDASRIARFSKKDMEKPGGRFAFMRVIADVGGSGVIIEVFDMVGALKVPIADIVRAPRLFAPIPTSTLAMYKKRWPLLGRQAGYDRERDSGYSTISLVMGLSEAPVLWTGGMKKPISVDDAKEYEPWTIWGANQIEKRIIGILRERGEPV